MNDQHPARADGTPRTAPTRTRTEPNRYAITLAALVASAQVAVAEQLQEQPVAPFHDYSVGFDTSAGDGGDGGGDGGE